MLNFRIFSFVVGIACIINSAKGSAQSLFSYPRPAPDYNSYRNIEECHRAGSRIQSSGKRLPSDSIFTDTISIEEARKLIGAHPTIELVGWRKPAIDTLRLCLNKFNPDTAHIATIDKLARIVKLLLLAHRDEDAERTLTRFLDSVRRESESAESHDERKKKLNEYKSGMRLMFIEHVNAKPIRKEKLIQYYTQLDKIFQKDSLYYRIDFAAGMQDIYGRIFNDTVARDSFRTRAIRLNDSTSVEERLASPNANNRLSGLASFVAYFARQEGLDSISVSNVAYNLWYHNTVIRRVFGGELYTREKAQPKKLPEINGAFYYSANKMMPDSVNTIRKGFAQFTSHGELPKNQVPIRNRMTMIRAMPGLCHTDTPERVVGEKGGATNGINCISYANQIRNFKRKYPDIELVGVSATYGTLGFVGPLNPQQEADTLARYFLGFLHMPIHLVVENTEFFNLAKPDNRRVDIVTPNTTSLGRWIFNMKDLKILTDKEGYMLEVPGIEGKWFDMFYDILRNRPNS